MIHFDEILFTNPVKGTSAGDGLFVQVNFLVNFHAAHEKIRILLHQFKVALSLSEQGNPSCYLLLQNDIKRSR